MPENVEDSAVKAIVVAARSLLPGLLFLVTMEAAMVAIENSIPHDMVRVSNKRCKEQ